MRLRKIQWGSWWRCVRSQGAYLKSDHSVIVLCTMFLVSCVFSNKYLYFSYYMDGYFLDRPHTLQSIPACIFSAHLAPYVVITILLAAFPMLYFTTSWLFWNYQFVLLNPFIFFTQFPNPPSSLATICLSQGKGISNAADDMVKIQKNRGHVSQQFPQAMFKSNRRPWWDSSGDNSTLVLCQGCRFHPGQDTSRNQPMNA